MLQFHKYQGAGNDFVLIDARGELPFSLDERTTIARLCDRRFGIGADGLMLLRQHREYDFEMLYYNADGRPSSLCGNGGRCIVAFARRLGMIEHKSRFLAVDGPHDAGILKDGQIALAMHAVTDVERVAEDFILDTGSPHYVRFVEGLEEVPLVEIAWEIRYGERFGAAGINVNLVEESDVGWRIRTYERGVEAETLACGTGVTAAAVVIALRRNEEGPFDLPILTRGGRLRVRGIWRGDRCTDLWLTGPAEWVFSGQIEL